MNETSSADLYSEVLPIDRFKKKKKESYNLCMVFSII